jgi:hypothetical protein
VPYKFKKIGQCLLYYARSGRFQTKVGHFASLRWGLHIVGVWDREWRASSSTRVGNCTTLQKQQPDEISLRLWSQYYGTRATVQRQRCGHLFAMLVPKDEARGHLISMVEEYTAPLLPLLPPLRLPLRLGGSESDNQCCQALLLCSCSSMGRLLPRVSRLIAVSTFVTWLEFHLPKLGRFGLVHQATTNSFGLV